MSAKRIKLEPEIEDEQGDGPLSGRPERAQYPDKTEYRASPEVAQVVRRR